MKFLYVPSFVSVHEVHKFGGGRVGRIMDAFSITNPTTNAFLQ